MKPHATQLAAKVAARNKLNLVLRGFVPAVHTAIAPFVGKKVAITDNALAKKFKEALPSLKGNAAVHVAYFSASDYTLSVNVKVSETFMSRNNNEIAVYADSRLSVGNLKDSILENVIEFDTNYHRIDFTEAEVEEQRRLLDFYTEKTREYEFKLAHFGRYDS